MPKIDFQILKKYINRANISFQIKQYNELENSKKFDCAILAIPEKAHLECLKFLVKKTTQIICVKPFTNNKNEFREALELSKNQIQKFLLISIKDLTLQILNS